jgi:hypothetical protein
MADHDPSVDIDALPDALVLHVLLHLRSAKWLCRCRAVSSRWLRLASDDEPWRAWCHSQFGLEEAAPPAPSQPCASYFDAGRQWTAHAAALGLPRNQPIPALCPLWRRAVRAWGRIEAWTAAHLPSACPTIGAPSTLASWRAALRRLDLDDHPLSEGPLLALRLLTAVHDGQRMARDAQIGSTLCAQLPDEGEMGELTAELTRASLGPDAWCDTANEYLGLCGGFSAYDIEVSVRPLPLALVVVWTRYLREKAELPEHLLAVGTSIQNRRVARFLVYDLETGDLLLGQVNAAPRLERRPIVVLGVLRAVRAVPPSTPRGADLLVWLEELGRRLSTGVYQAGPIVPLEPATLGINLFPQSGPKFSSATTRGIRVDASAICVPDVGQFMYSIRIVLLTPGEEGYLAPEERGFVTAQLHTRRWLLRNADGTDSPVEVCDRLERMLSRDSCTPAALPTRPRAALLFSPADYAFARCSGRRCCRPIPAATRGWVAGGSANDARPRQHRGGR